MNPFAAIGRIFARRRASESRYPDQQRVFTGRPIAGVRITPDTAVTVAAVWACLRYLSQTVAVLPWHVMLDKGAGGEIARTHPVDWLLWKRPNPEWSAFQFRETLTHWALRWGNGYAEIERDPIGRAVALWPIHPDRVQVKRDPVTGALVYEVTNDLNAKVTLAAADMFHVRGFGEGPVGVNVMEYAAESIGWAKAAQLFGAAFFGNGMNIAGVVQTKGTVGPAAITRITDLFKRLYGGVRKSNQTVVLDADMEWKPIQLDPEKGQMIATNQHLIEEVCRWFGVPPHKIAHLLRSTFSNIEHQAIEVVVDTITPWVKRFEEEADYKLFGQNRPGFYTRINMNGLLRGDTTARAAWYKAMREAGVYSADDILRREDEPVIGKAKGGEKRLVQLNQTTLEKIGEEPVEPAMPAAANDSDPAEVAAMRAIEIMAATEPVHAL